MIHFINIGIIPFLFYCIIRASASGMQNRRENLTFRARLTAVLRRFPLRQRTFERKQPLLYGKPAAIAYEASVRTDDAVARDYDQN